ncbi:NAD(P)-dependent oxidoreductase [Rhizobium sp. TH2]|uniref:NAD-dependent epimerase/dehydratase family protein n=1 Tax=Rhizobium sp. TH2 TaxID=2775403 RepID=UPI0021570587|nr:NAD(P)-dependent oxidoreductase [Rhizobium sp. TH2]UVC10824.1 NAD(P)-dependent oxidoreductase [Rhizobium sp. TH2]
MHILVTGAAGKVGQAFIAATLADPTHAGTRLRALCHNRLLPETDRLSVVQGSIAERDVCRAALDGITHVVHLATCKEVPETVMDVTVKGLFWLLEEFRLSPHAKRFLLVGGDAAVGHFFHKHPAPITEDAPYMAYPGCYALSKVLEEVMVQQFGIQYDMDWTCVRAPWIMEKDDFKASLSFGDDLFGGPDWKTMVSEAEAGECRSAGAVPLLRDASGHPIDRNFVHVDDLVAAISLALVAPAARQRLYNICMDEPVNYARLADHLAKTRGLPSKDIKSNYVSNWMDNSRAKAELGWRPRYDLEKLIEASWQYQRSPNDERRVWYPG